MVDSWAPQPKPEYQESGDFHSKLTEREQEQYFNLASSVTTPFKDRRTILRMDSKDAARAVPDASLDLAFIDADHSYEGCKSDLEAWYPKVRPGGIFSGHDFENTEFPGFGVTQAVTEFITSHNLHLELGENFTWFVSKPNQGA